MSGKPLTAVVCARYSQFEDWCRENGRNPRDPSLKMVMEIHHVQGCEFDSVVDLGGRPGIAACAESRVRKPVEET